MFVPAFELLRRSPMAMARRRRSLAALLSVVGAELGAQGVPVSGMVRDTFGLAIAGAEATVEGTAIKTYTDSLGAFRFPAVAIGHRRLVFRRLGFRPVGMDVEVTHPGVEDVDVLMVHTAQTLAAVRVEARGESVAPRLRGYYERKEQRVGHFITRERIERTHSFSFTDLLREIPGVTIRRIGQIEKAVRFRGAACPPLVFVDGFAATAAEFDLEMLDPGMLEGVEVYLGGASVPAVFAGPRSLDRCGVVAVWSRPAPSRRRQPPASIPRERVDVEALLAQSDVFTYQQVDTVARLIEGTLTPILPDELLREGKTGRVLVEFVVDTLGRAEPSSINIVSASHPALSAPVREALAEATFLPAVRRGRPERQMIQVPLDLDLGPRKPK
jgi:TonB family protein